MSATDQPLLKAQGIPGPQYFNPPANRYEEQTGRDGAAWYHQRGTVTIDYINGSTDTTKNYTNKCYGFAIVNDGDGEVRAIVNFLTIVVKAGESFESLFKPFTSIKIESAGVPYRAVVKE